MVAMANWILFGLYVGHPLSGQALFKRILSVKMILTE